MHRSPGAGPLATASGPESPPRTRTLVNASEVLILKLHCPPLRVSRLLMLLLLLLASHGAMAANKDEACPTQLRVGFINWALPPLIVGDDRPSAELKGLALDWTRAAVASTGCKPQLIVGRYPINRGRDLLAHGELDIWAISIPGPEMLQIGALPMRGSEIDPQLGFYSGAYSFYVPAASTVQWDGRTLSGPGNLTVGIAPVPALRDLAKARGWKVELGLHAQNSFEKLLSGRSSAALLPDLLVNNQAEVKARRVRALSPPVMMLSVYSVGSKAFAAQYPGFIATYWLEMCRQGRREQKDKTPCRAG